MQRAGAMGEVRLAGGPSLKATGVKRRTWCRCWQPRIGARDKVVGYLGMGLECSFGLIGNPGRLFRYLALEPGMLLSDGMFQFSLYIVPALFPVF